MDLKEYRELNKRYFHKDGFAINAESDKDKTFDEEILKCIIKDNPEIGRTVVGFILQDQYFLWHSFYPDFSESEIVETSKKIVRYINNSVEKAEDDSLPALETLLRENRNKIDYRRLLLNTVTSVRGAIEYARQTGAPQAAINKMEERRKRIIAQAKRFRPHVEDPEIYMITPAVDSRNIAELVYISWDETIEGKSSRTVVDLGLSTAEMRNIERLFNLEDTRLIPTSWECGKHVETYLALGLDQADTKGNQIKTEDAYAIVKEILRKPEYQRMIDPAKYHFLALYRALEFIESYTVADEETFMEIPDKQEILVLAKKLKELVEKDYDEGNGIDEPFTVFMDDNRFESKYKYDAEMLIDTGAAGMIDKVSIADVNNYYYGITREYIDRLVEHDSMVSIELYQKKALSLPEFVEYIKESDEKNYIKLINKAYDKKIINDKIVEVIMKDLGKRDEESLRKLGVAELKYILPRVKSATYANNAVLDQMLLAGVINQDMLIQQYFNGMLKEEDLTSFARYIESSEATKETVDSSKMKFNPQVFAQVYTQLNLKKIVNVLANKEHFDKELLSDFMKERPYLIKDCTPEQLEEFQKTFILQNKLLKKLDIKEQKEFMDALGYVACAQGIAYDLFDKGIISKNVAEEYGTTEFLKQYQKTQLVDGLRYNDLASIKNLINAYNHGRISLSKILRKYAEGAISPEIYFAFKENRDMTDAIDKAYLISLYEKYAKTGKKADLEVLETYYKEFKDIVKDEKDLEEINKKQLELINSKKSSKTNVVTMARSGVIDKDNIVMMDIETIAQLIMSGNTLNRDTARELFRDTDGTTTKRDRLEELFKRGLLTQDEMFTILSNVYVGNRDSSQEQQEIDADNMNYFFDQDYFESEYGEMVERTDPTRHNRKNVGTVRNEQQRFPIKERIEFLYSLDTKESINYKAGPAIIIQLPGKNKVIMETLGTPGKNGAGTISDLTNHHTYIVSKNVFESIKDEIFESKEATTRAHRKEIESILMYRRLIDLYNERGKEIGMRRFRHNQYWESALTKYFEEPKEKDQKEVDKKDEKDIDD